MPRPRRVHLDGALYYLTVRSAPGTILFRDQQDLQYYLNDLLAQCKAHYGFKLYGYALLADQVHLVIETGGEGTVSEIMHALNSRYTKYHGKRYQRSGHLFQGRYRACVVEKEPYLLRLTRYIHLLPRPLMNSLPVFQGEDVPAPGVVDVEEVLERFTATAPQGYLQFVNAAPAEEFEQLTENLRRPVIGSPDFVASLTRPTAAPESMPSQSASPKSRRGPFLAATLAVGVLSALTSAMLLPRLVADASGRGIITRPATASPPAVSQGAPPASPGVQLAAFSAPAYFLPGSTWEIQIKPMTATGAAQTGPQTDRLRFDGQRVFSEWLSGRGFSGSNYTPVLQPDGTVVWETMQTGSNGEVVCWRGEWQGQTMRGIMTRQIPGAQVETYRFLGVSKSDDGQHQTTSEI